MGDVLRGILPLSLWNPKPTSGVYNGVMPIVLKEREVRRAIQSWLFRNNWGRNYQEKETHEQGIDIKVRHNDYSRYFLIETKGGSTAKSARSMAETSFVYSLGQIVTRMKAVDARYYYGLGLPHASAMIAVRRIPWQFAKKMLIHVFSVDVTGKVTLFTWKHMRDCQKAT